MRILRTIPYPRTIRQRIVGLTALLLALSLAAVAFFSYRNVNLLILKNAYTSNYAYLNTVNGSFQSATDRAKWKISQHGEELGTLARQYDAGATSVERIEIMRAINGSIQYFLLKNPEFEGAMVVGETQTAFAGSFAAGMTMDDVKALPLYAAMTAERDHVAYAPASPYSSAGSLLFGKWLTGGEAAGGWAVLYLLNGAAIQTPASDSDLYIYRLDERRGGAGTLLWASQPNGAPDAAKLLAGVGGNAEGNFYAGKSYLTYIRDSEKGLLYVNKVNLNAVQERLSRLSRYILVAATALAALFSFSGYLFARRLTRPLDRLKSGMQSGGRIDGLDDGSRLRRLTLRTKLMLFLALHTIAPAAALGVLIYVPADQLVAQKVKSEIEHTVASAGDTIRSLKDGIVEFAGELANFDEVQQLFQPGGSGTLGDVASRSISMDIAKQGDFIRQIPSIQIYDIQWRLRYATSNLNRDWGSGGDAHESFRQAGTYQLWDGLRTDAVGNAVFPYYRQFRLKMDETGGSEADREEAGVYAPVGYIKVDVQQSLFEDRIRPLQWGANSGVYLMDRDGAVISALNRRYLGLSAASLGLQGLYGNEAARTSTVAGNWLMSYPLGDGSGWSLVVQIPKTELTKDNSTILWDDFYLLLVVVLINALLSIYFTWRITEPITGLYRLMGQVGEGNYDGRLPSGREKDELTLLSRQFNRMTERIHTLIHEVYEAKIRENELEMKQQQLERRKKEAEIIAFQSQINPHFLYNTFSSIHFMIALGQSEKAIRMLNAVGRLFRKGVFRGTVMVGVEEEIEHVKAYLDIQEMRFEEKLRVAWSIDPALYGFRMIKLTLQPLVENAIFHGIERKEGGGAIAIKGELADGRIVFTVADTGIGMDADKLAEVREVLAGGQTKQIGMKNVDDRIKLYFGSGSGLEIDSVPNEGTTVRMRFPSQAVESPDAARPF